MRDAVVGNHYQVYIFGNAQITAERLDIIVDLDLRIEAVCLFGQFVEFQLEHFVFGDRSDIVTSLCIPVKRVGVCKIIVRDFQRGLCRCQVKKAVGRIGCYQFECFDIGLFASSYLIGSIRRSHLRSLKPNKSCSYPTTTGVLL